MTAPTYDPTLKALVETEPDAWPPFFGSPVGPTTVIDADIGTVSGAADKVLHVAARPPYLLHVEFVAGHDAASLPAKVHVHNALLAYRHELPVRSAVVLLTPNTDSPQLTGRLAYAFPGEAPYLEFRYQVVRVWQLPPEPLLTGPVALLPLAPISAVTERDLPAIIKQIEKRLGGRRQAAIVWSAAYILLGLRHSPQEIAELLRGVQGMKESSTYQAIMDEGRTEGAVAEARRLLRLIGDDAFGPPDARSAALIERLEALDHLEELIKKVRTAASWNDLLGKPSSRPRGAKRKR